MHIAQFVHRYPPALGGAEAYTARLCAYLAACGDDVTVWTTTAVELEEFWRAGGNGINLPPCGGGGEALRAGGGKAFRDSKASPPTRLEDSTTSPTRGEVKNNALAGRSIHRYPPLHFPARRYLLKAASLVPVRPWQCVTTPCNPVCPQMWRDAGRYAGPLDAVHATAFPYSFPIMCGLRLAGRRGVPFFITPFLHIGDIDNPNDRTRKQYTKPHLRWLLRQADGVFVQTRAESDIAVSLGVREDRVHLQGLGVDPAECTDGDRERVRAEWNMECNEVVIGHLANNSEEKGTCDLLRAAEQVWNLGQRFRVVLAGPEMPNFRAFWDGFAIKRHVTRLGVLTDEQKRDFFAGIDAFALPSRTDSFGLVLLEAWANGKPNLVYRAGGPGELVQHERDGLHAKCGDVAELSQQLARLVTDAELRRRLGDTGLSRIPTEFAWERSLSLFRDVVAEASQRETQRFTSALPVEATRL